ncbi:hypothetical protein [Cupriavidus sp. UYPR2.512]|uniref:hypothetical protein n=1 Tax=Cupriavidus sp. UYPR2.512 TaxID=1080187 RepID=UPI0012F7B92A|nr:hypothetical protein [Cupriavidus sp. UYPR2.512]UIF89008.1 hypothetical protein KAF44_27845 [Cupriavidus necator]
MHEEQIERLGLQKKLQRGGRSALFEEIKAKAQFQEALAILFAIAFPPTKKTADEVFMELTQLLEQPVTDAQIIGRERPFNLRSQLRGEIPTRHRKLYDFFKEFMPEEDQLDD